MNASKYPKVEVKLAPKYPFPRFNNYLKIFAFHV